MGWGKKIGGFIDNPGSVISDVVNTVTGVGENAVNAPTNFITGTQANIDRYNSASDLWNNVSTGMSNPTDAVVGFDAKGGGLGQFQDDWLGLNRPAKDSGYVQQAGRSQLDDLNDLFGVGSSAAATENRARFNSKLDEFKTRFVNQLSRQSYDQWQNASGNNAATFARAGFGANGSSETDRLATTNAEELGTTLAKVKDAAAQQVDSIEQEREQRREQLANLVINGGNYDASALNAELARNDRAMGNVLPTLAGDLFSQAGNALYLDQAGRRQGGQGLFGSSDPVGSLFGG